MNHGTTEYRWSWESAKKASSRVAGCFAIGTCLSCGVALDQGLSEPMAIRNCYAAIRDGKYKSTKDCSEYARFHLALYTEIDQSTPYRAACGFSQHRLDYVRSMHPKEKNLLSKAEKLRDEDCVGIFKREGLQTGQRPEGMKGVARRGEEDKDQ